MAADRPALRVTAEWEATAAAKAGHAAVTYRSPCCNQWHEINVQLPAAGDPVTTELWCHRDMVGTPATVELG